MQATVKFDAEGKITSDVTAPVQSKNVIKEGYGMKDISPIKKEWYEQAAAFCSFVTGKTLSEACGMSLTEKGSPADVDLATSCTIGVTDFIKLLIKAAQ